MKTKSIVVTATMTVLLLEAVLSGCKKDPSGFVLESILAGTVVLHDSTRLATVPVDPVFVATFSHDVDVTTADSANISLIQDYDKTAIALEVAASGKTITITPNEVLVSGAIYKLTLQTGLRSTGGLVLTEVSRSFITLGTFVPKGALAYWNFEDNANDQVGTFHPAASGIVDITYSSSRNAAAGKAADFNGTTSIIEVPNGDVLMNSPNFTLSFWLKTNSAGHLNQEQKPAGYFVMGLAAFFGFEFEISADFSWCNLAASYDITEGKAAFNDLLFPGDGLMKDNGGWQGDEFCKNLAGSGGVASLIKDKWAQIACTYEASTKRGTMYVNGEKVKVFNFNLWPEGNERRRVTGLKYSGISPETVNELAFGFIQSRAGILLDNDPKYGYDFPTSNHFKGQLDDIRIFHKALTDAEIKLMHDSEK